MSDPIADARALVARLGGATDDDAPPADVAAALVAAEASADRPMRKEIRRALYRLGQAGVAVPSAPATAPPPVLGPAIEAWVSAVDGRGDRLAWLVREQPSGALVLVAAELNEPAGLRDLHVLDVTRKQLRTMRQRFQAEGRLTLVEADWRAVDALVVEAEARLQTPDRKLEYGRVRSRLTTLPPAAPGELASTRLRGTDDDDERARLVAESARLLEEPELRTWWPGPEDTAPILDEIRAIRESPLVVSKPQQEERLREVLARATRALYPPEVMARRLAATAFVLAETGRLEAARRALAVAASLRMHPTVEVPLLQALALQGIGTQLAATEAGRRDERAGALVLTPGEIATAKSPSRPPRSRG